MRLYLGAGLAQSLDRALSTTWPTKVVSINKCVTKRSIDGVSVEQSDLDLSESPFKQTKWRSVCLECSSIPQLEKLLERKVEGRELKTVLETIPGSVMGGYPAFILTLLDSQKCELV